MKAVRITKYADTSVFAIGSIGPHIVPDNTSRIHVSGEDYTLDAFLDQENNLRLYFIGEEPEHPNDWEHGIPQQYNEWMDLFEDELSPLFERVLNKDPEFADCVLRKRIHLSTKETNICIRALQKEESAEKLRELIYEILAMDLAERVDLMATA